jgi:hypothetical protein
MMSATLPPLAPDDLGTDVALTDDLAPAWGVASGKSNLAMAIYRRLTTTRGGLFYDASYGYSLMDLLNAELSAAELSEARGSIIAECEKDERVQAVTANLAFDSTANQLTIDLELESAAGPFDLVLRASEVTVEILTLDGQALPTASATGATGARAGNAVTVIYASTAGASAPAAPPPTPPADQVFDTKVMRAGVPGSTSFGTFDLVYPWGMVGNWYGWGVNGGATDPINVLNAFPHVFPKDCTLKAILIKNQVGVAATRYKLGICSNLGDGLVFPGAKLAEMAEQNPLPSGITGWACNLAITAGTMLWIVHTCDNTGFNINLGGLPPPDTMQIMGIGSDLLTDPIIGWQAARTYDGTLPSSFPTSSPTKLIAGSHTMPAFFMRFG